MWSLRTIPASVIATGPIGRRLPTRSTKISEIVEDFLKLQGFDYYGLPETEKTLIGFFGHQILALCKDRMLSASILICSRSEHSEIH